MTSKKRKLFTEEGLDAPEIQEFLTELIDGGHERLQQEPVLKHIPFCEALGMRLLAMAPGEALMAAPYREDLIGNTDSGVIHGGVVTTLIDNVAGMAAAMNKGFDVKMMATLDLRIDYMRPAEPGKVIFAKARRFRRARHIAFVRAVAFEASADDPLAMGVGVFMDGGKVTEKDVAAAAKAEEEAGR